MTPGFEDQAAGLRRLLRRAPPTVVATVACGAGAVRWLAEQAGARGQGGRHLVAFDEASASGNLADALGLAPRFDLLQAVERHVGLEAVRVDARPGVSLYPVARLVQGLPAADRVRVTRVIDTFRRLQQGADLWLINARPDDGLRLSPLASAAHRLVVVLDGSARGATEAYGVLKRIENGPWAQVDLVLSPGRDPAAAEALLASLETVLQREGGLPLRRIATLDAAVAAAAITPERSTERFVERVLGMARRPPYALGV